LTGGAGSEYSTMPPLESAPGAAEAVGLGRGDTAVACLPDVPEQATVTISTRTTARRMPFER